jgi:hypothetical protein
MKSLDGFHFDYDLVFYQEVTTEARFEKDAVIDNGYWLLAGDG